MFKAIINWILSFFLKKKPEIQKLDKQAAELEKIIEELENVEPGDIDEEIDYWNKDKLH